VVTKVLGHYKTSDPRLSSFLLKYKTEAIPPCWPTPPPYRFRVNRELRPSSDLSLDSINDARFGQGTEVTQLISLSRRDLAHNAAHDLTRSGLGKVGNDYNFLWGCERPDDLPDLKDELLSKVSFTAECEFTR
jgi:hypothetical protein